MIIPLKENKPKFLDKLLNKEPKLIKEKGENILMVGCTGSGKAESLLSLFSLLLSGGYIEDRSIMVNIYGDNSIYARWLSILSENKKRDITSKDFTLFNSINQEEKEIINKIKFKSGTVQKSLNPHVLFMYPALEKTPHKKSGEMHKQLYDFLNNLPVNNGKEIPILISDIYLLRKNDYRRYSKMVKKLNNKGYFFIVTIEGYSQKLNLSLPILKDVFRHILIMKTYSEDPDLNAVFEELGLSRNIRNLNAGQYYYLKDFGLMSNKVRNLPYLYPELLKTLPEYEKLDKFLLMAKINNF